jgi:hypothetical protein
MGRHTLRTPQPKPCPWCNGLRVETVIKDGEAVQIPCGQCDGTGKA